MFFHSRHHSIDFYSIYRQIEHLPDELPWRQAKKRKRSVFRIWRSLLIAASLGLVLVLVFTLYIAISARQAYTAANAAKNDLESAVALAKERDYSRAADLATSAERGFGRSLATVQSVASSTIVRAISGFFDPTEDAERLLSAAANISGVVAGATAFAADVRSHLTLDEDRTIDQITTAEKRLVLARIRESGGLFERMSGQLDTAYGDIEAMSRSAMLRPFRARLIGMKTELGPIRDIMAKAGPLSQVLPLMLGYPEESNYLFILQNNDELRPTGGFVGTFGNVTVQDAEIKSFSTHDVYHLDMPVQDAVTTVPPEPLKKYLKVNKWFLRDANWSPDWRRSADKIEELYWSELKLLRTARRGEADPVLASAPIDLDGLIGVTPEVFTDLLTIIGPVTVEGVSYDASNFMRLLEYRVEKGYVELGVPSWQRKEVIGTIAKEIEKKLSSLPLSRVLELAEALDRRLQSKDIVFRIKEERVAAVLRSMKLSGEMVEPVGDYVMVVDANLAALKTDAVMSRSLDYRLVESPTGLTARLVLAYSHEGAIDWRTSRYQSFVRVYVPAGSRLVKAEGPLEGPMTAGIEEDRTVFSGWLIIPAGEVGLLKLEYQLPPAIADRLRAGHYELYLQRQPGTRVDNVAVAFDLLRPIESITPGGFSGRINGIGQVSWTGDFPQDRQFIIETKR